MNPRIALAVICKGSNDEAKLLDRCLESVAPYVDGIFITRTQLPDEPKNYKVAKVARKYKAKLSDFEWVYDFSKARNFNFSQVPKDFTHIMWTDADDIWRGLENLKQTIKDHPHTDGFGFWYLYDWDEFKLPTVVHRKTMVVRNDGCTTWVGALHEDLMETRGLDIHLVEGIERLHLTYKERADNAAQRNLVIASKTAATSTDPRDSWNLANAFYSVGDMPNARKAYEQFLEDTGSDEEKYLALMRVSETCKDNGAVEYLQRAIGLRPSLPDAYFQMAYYYYNQSNWDKAEEYCLTGLRKRPQIHRSIVFNPRDYDYNPMMLLAKIYYNKNRPDLMLPLLEGCLKIYPNDERLKTLVKDGKEEKDALEKALHAIEKLETLEGEELRKAIDKLDPEIRSHPAVCAIRNMNFVKTESSGKDLVIYCGNTVHQWNPELFKTKGFGGSEEAVVHLAREWAKLGWNVTVYNNCGHKVVQEVIGGGVIYGGHPTKERINKIKVTYRPFWEWNYRDKQDITILWRWSKPLDFAINSTKIFVDVHDVVPQGEFNEQRLKKVDKVFVKTQFHRSLFPNVPDEKIEVIPNGFEGYLDPKIKKDPYLVINTSSPDRSLDVLPALWARVREQFPKARMQWMYGWTNFDNSFAEDSKKMLWKKQIHQSMEEAGIEDLGRLTQAEVGRKYQEASFLAYPSNFAEIFCISVLKAQAAGCMPITTDFGAFKEINKFGTQTPSKATKDTWAKPYQYHFGITDLEEQDAWVEAMVSALKNQERMDMHSVSEWVQGFSWENVARKWNEHFV